ncbi:alpha-galactosidase [Shigella boydii]|nr:alpha-galactosidase [Shigella boydii]
MVWNKPLPIRWGPGGIMRALRTIPHLWQICEDMTEVCPDATLLNYVNPMAMNTWAMYARYPHIKQVGAVPFGAGNGGRAGA